jgi:hypothetical protein
LKTQDSWQLRENLHFFINSYPSLFFFARNENIRFCDRLNQFYLNAASFDLRFFIILKYFFMKKLILSFITFVAIAANAQTSVSSKESLDVSTAYNQNKNKAGTFVLGKTKAGYTISMVNKTGSSPQIIITDPKGNIVPAANNERRVVINGPDGTRCLECYNVDRNGTPTEECYRVSCNEIDKLGGSRRTN